MKSQMGKRLSVQIPPFRPSPPARLPIGGRTGRFRVLEATIYFDYVGNQKSQDRNFEFTLRIPMTKHNRRVSLIFWEFVASVKMEEASIHIEGKNWDKGIVGYRYTGKTDAIKPRYICINKLTRWCMPKRGGWGVLRI